MINFTYSKDLELKEICWIYSEYDFFIKNKYKVFYPKISKDIEKELIANPKDKLAIKQLKQQFDKIFANEEDIYKRTLRTTESGWLTIGDKFFNELAKIQTGKGIKNVHCCISRYGPGGSYYSPNKISVRVVDKYDKDIREANEKIAHEIVHLAIDKLVQKYSLSFDNTERLVDLILTRTPISELLVEPTIQGFGNENLDECFKTAFPSIENVLKLFCK